LKRRLARCRFEQGTSLKLIASENYASPAVLLAMATGSG
jgi:glycine/serine hydroxymethyltransferase